MYFNFSKLLKVFILTAAFIIILPACEDAPEDTPVPKAGDPPQSEQTTTTIDFDCKCNPDTDNISLKIQAASATEAKELAIQQCIQKLDDHASKPKMNCYKHLDMTRPAHLR